MKLKKSWIVNTHEEDWNTLSNGKDTMKRKILGNPVPTWRMLKSSSTPTISLSRMPLALLLPLLLLDALNAAAKQP